MYTRVLFKGTFGVQKTQSDSFCERKRCNGGGGRGRRTRWRVQDQDQDQCGDISYFPSLPGAFVLDITSGWFRAIKRNTLDGSRSFHLSCWHSVFFTSFGSNPAWRPRPFNAFVQSSRQRRHMLPMQRKWRKDTRPFTHWRFPQPVLPGLTLDTFWADTPVRRKSKSTVGRSGCRPVGLSRQSFTTRGLTSGR